jgi:hypothetical protein
MEITKKELLENFGQEFNEMAERPKGKQAQRTNLATGQPKLSKNKPIFFEDNSTNIPDAWIICPTQNKADCFYVVCVSEEEKEQFIADNEDAIDRLSSITGKDILTYHKRLSSAPRNKEVGTPYTPTGNKRNERDMTLRKFNPIVNAFVIEVNDHLVSCGLPPIQTWKNRAFVDSYAKVSKTEINWESHDYDYYKNITDFATAANELYLDGKTNVQIYRTHMPRSYNPGVNWSPMRKMEQMGAYYKTRTKTAKYKLPRWGYEAEANETFVSTTLAIRGMYNHIQNSYHWYVEVKIEVGKKLKDENQRVLNKLINDKRFESKAHGEIEGGQLAEVYVALDIESVTDALKTALEEMKEKLLKIDADSELVKRFNVKQTDIAENTNKKLNTLIQDTLKNL